MRATDSIRRWTRRHGSRVSRDAPRLAPAGRRKNSASVARGIARRAHRFEREALAVGKVDHPNCVATYDVGRLPDGSLYLAMELLEGRSLADVLEMEGQLAPDARCTSSGTS